MTGNPADNGKVKDMNSKLATSVVAAALLAIVGGLTTQSVAEPEGLVSKANKWSDFPPAQNYFDRYDETVHVKYFGYVNLRSFDCTYPSSSFINRVCYDAPYMHMVIALNGTYYHYCLIDADTMDDFQQAPSKGLCQTHQGPF